MINMAKTANINVRVDPVTKANAEQLFSTFGITVTDAINMFLHQSLLVGGLPFELRQPRYNLETEQAIAEARHIATGQLESKSYNSTTELFKELNDEC